MKEFENIAELITSLIKARSKFPEIKKDKKGQEGHREYWYADLDSIWKAVEPSLTENGLFVQHLVDVVADSCIITCRIWHKNGAHIDSIYPIPDPREGKIKEWGAYQTYLRRYSLEAILGITGEQDDDGGSNFDKGKKKSPPKKPIKNHAPGAEGPKVWVKCTYNQKELQAQLKAMGFKYTSEKKLWWKSYDEKEVEGYQFEYTIEN